MLLPDVLFVLFLAGWWLYCLTDAALTPAEAYPGWPKRAWIAVIAATLIAGAAAWTIARWTWRARYWQPGTRGHQAHADVTRYQDPPTASAADAALARHPASRSRAGHPGGPRATVPRGPDDDAEFLRQLDRRIRGELAQLTPA